MSSTAQAEDQLLELLLQLKKSTPQDARAILSSQPQIAYALITLMVKMNAINVEVLQRTVAAFGGNPAQAGAPATAPSAFPPSSQSAPPSQTQAVPGFSGFQAQAATPASAVPPRVAQQMQPQRVPTPQQQQGGFPAFPANGQFGGSQGGPAPYGGANYPAAAPAPVPITGNLAAMALDTPAGISDEQKATIIRIITMTPEQINQLPAADRAKVVQLRSTLGIPVV